MSFVIQKIELQNIRSHGSYTFTPSQQGITAISGVNGTGKSTIVDSIPWILYGTKPAGVPKAISILKRGTDLTKEKAQAKIYLKIGATEVLVERKIVNKQGAIECNVYEKAENATDYKHTAGPSVSHAEPYIRRLLQLDERGFLAAVLVQQKQVDQLMTASSKERGETIEKLLGISSITVALAEAKQNYNTIKKAAKQYSIDEKLLPKLKNENTSLTKKVELAKKQHETTSTKVQKTKTTLDDLKGKVSTLEEKINDSQTLQKTIDSNTTIISSLRDELSRLTKEKDLRKKEISQLNTNGTANLKKIEQELSQKQTQYRKYSSSLTSLESNIESQTKRLTSIEKALAQAPTSSLEKTQNAINTGTIKRESLQKRIQHYSAQLISLDGELKKIREALQIVEDEDSVCPTCLQEVHDPQKTVEKLQESIEEAEEQIKSINTEKIESNSLLERVNKSIIKYEKIAKAYSEAQELKDSIASKEEKCSLLKPEIITCETEVKSLEKVYLSAQSIDSTVREYDSLKNRALQASNRIEELQKQTLEAQNSLKEMGSMNSEEAQKLRENFSKASDQYVQLSGELTDKREKLYMLENELRENTLQLASAQEELKNYNESLNTIEASGKTVEVLGEFRSNRITQSIPMVAVYASELMNKFTNGKFTQISLDEKFNATVSLANGEKCPVGLLSGGELSAASIALRLSISMMLNAGKNENAIILDEVLVSQDIERSEKILHAITEVCSGQVIIISHGANTTEIADTVIEL